MLKFYFNNKYNASSYFLFKKKIEDEFRNFFSNYFKEYSHINIKFELLPDNYFKNGIEAIADASKNIVKFNFDKCIDYMKHLKKLDGDDTILEIKKKKDHLSNFLYHEIQHIINNIEFKEMFDFVNTLETYSIIKMKIKDIIDEYIASYYAQKHFYIRTYAIEDLIRLCNEKDTIPGKQKINFFADTISSLTYSLAEERVIIEDNINNVYAESLLENESTRCFKDIFSDIDKLLREYDKNKYKIYVIGCQLNLAKLLDTLGIYSDQLLIK